jgi:undecaprenyl-diphosphatase
MKRGTEQAGFSSSGDPTGSPSTGRFSLRWVSVIVALLVAATLWLLLRQGDVTLVRWRYEIVGDEPGRAVEHFLGGLREFGQVLSVVMTIVVVAAYDRRRKTVIVAILLAEALSLAAFNAAKYTIARHRPYDAVEHVAPLESLTIASTWIGWRPLNKQFDAQSFPSGHSAAAFTLAGILAYFYPRLRWMFWPLAAGCAASRYFDAVHWPSDCLVGIAIGLIASSCAIILTLRKFPIRSAKPQSEPRP